MKEFRLSEVIKSFLPSIGLILIQTVVSWAAAYGVIAYQAYTYTDGTFDQFIDRLMEISSSTEFNLAVLLCYSVAGVIFFGIWYRHSFVTLGGTGIIQRNTNAPILTLLGIVLIAVGMQYVCVYIINVLASLFPQWLAEYEEILTSAGFEDGLSVPLVLYSVILGPICEELCFRGLTLRYAKRTMPFWVANLIQAVLFAAIHQNWLQSSYTFLFALILGLIADKSGGIFLGVIIHIFFNGYNIFFGDFMFGGSTPMSFALILYVSLVVTYLGYLLIVRHIPHTVEKDATDANHEKEEQTTE